MGQNVLARHYFGVKIGLMVVLGENTPFQAVMDFRVIHIKSKEHKTSQ